VVTKVVAGKLAEFGCQVHRNIGKNGVVMSNRLIAAEAWILTDLNV
jgi:hypothetical protein